MGTACGPRRLRLRVPARGASVLCAWSRRGLPAPRGAAAGLASQEPGPNAAASCVFFPVFYLFTAGMQTPPRHPALCSTDTDIFSHLRGMFSRDLTFLL